MQAGSLIAAEGSVELARPIIARAERADGSSPVSDQALLAVAQGQRALVLFSLADAAGGGQAGGAAVGGTAAGDARTPDGQPEAPGGTVAVGVIGQGELDLVVDPAARGRGVGTAALRALLAHPRAAETAPDGEPGVLAWAHGENPAATALLRGAGFSAVRSLYRMALDPALLPAASADPFAVALPAGFVLRTFEADRPDDAADWVAVNARAFASHPEQGRVSLADFALMRAEAWFDPADLFLLAAADSAGLAGFTWVKTLRDGGDDSGRADESDDAGDSGNNTASTRTETELYAIGVDPDYAGTGLGRALLDVTLARMAQHRPERVTLYVDGENERAVHIYERAGFTIDTRSTQWRGPGAPQVSE